MAPVALPPSRYGAPEAHLGVSSLDCGGQPELTAAFWDEARGELTVEQRLANLSLVLALGVLSWVAPVVLFYWLVA